MDLVFSVTLKHPCLSHSHCLWYVCLMLIWNSLHIYHPSLKALGNRTQCHCRSRKTVKQIYVHACWWEKGGGRGEKNDLFTTFSPWETSLFFSLWLNKLFINVKSCLVFGSSPRTRHPRTMNASSRTWRSTRRPSLLRLNLLPLVWFFFFFRRKGWRQQMIFTPVTVQELLYTSNGPGISRSVHLFTQHFGSHQHLTLW